MPTTGVGLVRVFFVIFCLLHRVASLLFDPFSNPPSVFSGKGGAPLRFAPRTGNSVMKASTSGDSINHNFPFEL
jgi:hypothetical protein